MDLANGADAVSTHSHLKVADIFRNHKIRFGGVSTHSHLKVAEPELGIFGRDYGGFNTQPPEGG